MWRVVTACDGASRITSLSGLMTGGIALFSVWAASAATSKAMTTPVVSKSALFSGPRFCRTTRVPIGYFAKSTITS